MYFFQGKRDYCKAVRQARKAYSVMSRRAGRKELEKYIREDLLSAGAIARKLLTVDLNAKMSERVKVKGIFEESIVLDNYAHKDRIFDYLRERVG